MLRLTISISEHARLAAATWASAVAWVGAECDVARVRVRMCTRVIHTIWQRPAALWTAR